MKKIPSLFVRDWDGDKNRVLPVVTEGCEWVVRGQSKATRKWDGTACLWFGGVLFKRYDAKRGKEPPAGFIPCQDQPDKITGHNPGWIMVGEGPADEWHREGVLRAGPMLVHGETYELCGPKLQGNPEKFDAHILLRHGGVVYEDVPRTYDGIREFLERYAIEGIVFHDLTDVGRMAKVKRKDLGLPWPVPNPRPLQVELDEGNVR